jgi:ribonuclease HI
MDVEKLLATKSIVVYFDGGCNQNPGGIATSGWVIYDAKTNEVLAEEGLVVQDGGELATNNYAEYCGLGHALRFLDDANWRGDAIIRADSNLVVQQVNDRWKCKVKHLAKLRDRVWQLMESLDLQFGVNCSLSHVPREQNSYADNLCRQALAEYVTES